jgi:hypothetical protein
MAGAGLCPRSSHAARAWRWARPAPGGLSDPGRENDEHHYKAALPPRQADATSENRRCTRSHPWSIPRGRLHKQQREVARIALPDGGAVVVDYRSKPLGDGRVVAQLAPDEPAVNAQVVCDLYLADESRGRCRSVSPWDFKVAKQPAVSASPPGERSPSAGKLCDTEGYVYRLQEVATETGAVRAALDTFSLSWPRGSL